MSERNLSSSPFQLLQLGVREKILRRTNCTHRQAILFREKLAEVRAQRKRDPCDLVQKGFSTLTDPGLRTLPVRRYISADFAS